MYRTQTFKWNDQMKHGSWYEKEFDLDPLIALILRWRWCRLSGMKEISFKKIDENHAELKQFKKITIEIKWKENQNPSARQGSGPVAGLKQSHKLEAIHKLRNTVEVGGWLAEVLL